MRGAVWAVVCAGAWSAVGCRARRGASYARRRLEETAARPEVQGWALSALPVMFVFSIGMLMFFMMSGALRAAAGRRRGCRDREFDRQARSRAEGQSWQMKDTPTTASPRSHPRP